MTVTDGRGTVSFTGCHFENWDNQLNSSATGFTHNGTTAIEQIGGTLIVTGSEFMDSGSPQILLGATAKKTIVTGNIIAGALKIVKAGGYAGKLVASNNLDDN